MPPFILTGIVTKSGFMKKTATVTVSRFMFHPKTHKVSGTTLPFPVVVELQMSESWTKQEISYSRPREWYFSPWSRTQSHLLTCWKSHENRRYRYNPSLSSVICEEALCFEWYHQKSGKRMAKDARESSRTPNSTIHITRRRRRATEAARCHSWSRGFAKGPGSSKRDSCRYGWKRRSRCIERQNHAVFMMTMQFRANFRTFAMYIMTQLL